MKKRLTILLLALCPVLLQAQDRDTLLTIEPEITDAFLDTVNIRKTLNLNNYSTFGIQYG